MGTSVACHTPLFSASVSCLSTPWAIKEKPKSQKYSWSIHDKITASAPCLGTSQTGLLWLEMSQFFCDKIIFKQDNSFKKNTLQWPESFRGRHQICVLYEKLKEDLMLNLKKDLFCKKLLQRNVGLWIKSKQLYNLLNGCFECVLK